MTVLTFPLTFDNSLQQNNVNRRIVFSQLASNEQNMSIGDHSNSATHNSSSNKPTATTTAATGSGPSRPASAAVMAPKQQKAGKRPGRKPSKINERDKLERSRQSARECRARKKLRYQYLEELVINREKAVFAIQDELKLYKQWCSQLDAGGPVPEALVKLIVSEDVENSRRQREQSDRALEKQQRRQQQEQKTSSSSSVSSSKTSTGSSSSPSSSSPPSASSPPFSKSSPPPPTSSSAMVAETLSQSQMAIAHASRLLMQHRKQHQQTTVAPSAPLVSRPQTLKMEPSSPTWSQIQHLIPKLSPTQPQQHQTCSPAATPSTSPQQRAATLRRQEAFDMTAVSQQQVQHQLQQAKSLLQKQQQQQLQQQQQQQQQQQRQQEEERRRLESQLSIPESVSSFILSSEEFSGTTSSNSSSCQYQQQQQPTPQMSHHYQNTPQYAHQLRTLPHSLPNQPERTTPHSVAPPNFLDISYNTPSRRTFQHPYMTKAKSDPMSSNAPSDLIMQSHAPSTTSVSPGSIPNFFDSRDVSRSRSLSNPSYMSSANRTQHNPVSLRQHSAGNTYSATTTVPYTDSSRTLHPSTVASQSVSFGGTVPSNVTSAPGPSVGLFSGSAMLPTVSFPAAGAVESESPSSSDENLNEQELFQFSSLTPQKRTLSDPILHGGKVRRTAPVEDFSMVQSLEHQQPQQLQQQQQRPAMSTAGATPFFSSSADEALLSDPHATLRNLTTMRCFSATRTSNTPSPSPSIGLVPMGVASPSPTPSCSSGSRSGSFSRSSPAPKPSVSPVPSTVTLIPSLSSLSSLPSLSSLCDVEDYSTLSPAAHAAVDTALDIFTSTVAARNSAPGFPGADCSSSTSLQASIEPIPEFMSYFTDIQEGGATSGVTSGGHGASNMSHVDVNVPTIIDEMLQDRDGSQ